MFGVWDVCWFAWSMAAMIQLAKAMLAAAKHGLYTFMILMSLSYLPCLYVSLCTLHWESPTTNNMLRNANKYRNCIFSCKLFTTHPLCRSFFRICCCSPDKLDLVLPFGMLQASQSTPPLITSKFTGENEKKQKNEKQRSCLSIWKPPQESTQLVKCFSISLCSLSSATSTRKKPAASTVCTASPCSLPGFGVQNVLERNKKLRQTPWAPCPLTSNHN